MTLVLSWPRALRLLRGAALVTLLLMATTAVSVVLSRSTAPGEIGALVLRSMSLTRERSLAALIASMLLALTAAVFVLCGFVERRRRAPWVEWVGWFALGAAFALLSLDELGSVHENVQAPWMPDLTGGYGTRWMVAITIPVLLFVAGVGAFALRLLRHDVVVMALLLVGTACFVSVLVQEMIEFQTWDPTFDRATAPPRWWFAAVLEEGSELLAALAFLAAGLRMLAGPPAWPGLGRGVRVTLGRQALRRACGMLLTVALAAAAGLALSAESDPLRFTREESGPIPWFSTVAVGATIAAALLERARSGRRARRGLALVVAAAAVWFLDQGTGLTLTELLWAGSPRADLAVHLALALFTLALAGAAALHFDDRVRRVRLLLWGALLAAAALLPAPLLVPTGVIAAQLVLAPALITAPLRVVVTGRRTAVRAAARRHAAV